MKKRLLLGLSLLPLLALAGCGQPNTSSSSASKEDSAHQASSMTASESSSESEGHSQASSMESKGGSQGSSVESQSSSQSSTSSSQEQSSSSQSSFSSTPVIQGSIEFVRFGGLFESAFVEWKELANAAGYNVYYQKAGESAWTKLDTQLIRKYPTYWRADALGLPAAAYSLKVTPVLAGALDEAASSVTSSFLVKSYHRDGFAYKGGSASGAYNEDGSLKSNAIVIYITDENKNSVVQSVMYGKAQTDFTGLSNILYALEKGSESHCFDFRFIGQIHSGFTKNKSSDETTLYVNNKLLSTVGITLEGVGNDATCYNWQFLVKKCNNVEIRNLAFMLCNSSGKDGLSVEQTNDHIWIHNNDVFYGMAGSDSDQVKGDGGIDIKKSDHVTMAYNHFFDSGKACLLENSDNIGAHVTYDHNWFDHSDSRHPRIRFDTVHVYNNYYDGNAKYGVGATSGSSVFVEANYFRNCKYPMLISMQGNDIAADGTGTFSSEDGGLIKAFGNHIEGGTNRPYSATNTTEFDDYEVAARTDSVPSTIVTKKGGTAYNNFDTTDSDVVTLDPVENVPEVVSHSAGRMEQGDFKWSFDNAVDDASYAINSALKAALSSYQTSLVAIGGNSI